jgi:hypothetical protein
MFVLCYMYLNLYKIDVHNNMEEYLREDLNFIYHLNVNL